MKDILNGELLMAKLKKDGTKKRIVQNKFKGDESEVYNLKPEDIKKLRDCLIRHGKWLHVLALGLATNLMLRAGDVLSFKWEHFYDPETGDRRERYKAIKEQKTDKKSCKYINDACWMEIDFYIAHTGCHPEQDNYSVEIFKQLTGNYRGRTLSESSFLKVIKKAAEEVGISYNVGTHSCRKTAGNIAIKRHAKDEINMETVSSLLNHSSVETTRVYTGVTREHMDSYLADLGTAWIGYAVNGEACNPVTHETTILFDISTARNFSKMVFLFGRLEGASRSGESDERTKQEIRDTLSYILDNTPSKKHGNILSLLNSLDSCTNNTSFLEVIYKIGEILQLT